MKKSKIGKVNGNGFNTSALIGALIGGAGSAVIDTQIAHRLPAIAGMKSSTILKVGAGVALPLLVKNNKMIEAGATALLACGVNDLMKETVFKQSTAVATTTGIGSIEDDITYIGRSSYVPFPEYTEEVSNVTGTAEIGNDLVG